MSYVDNYRFWKEDSFFDEAIRKELASLDVNIDKKEIEDRFYRELEFGTGGLRGIMGAGTNRMNQYTVGKATLGFGKYLLDTYGAETCIQRGVAIGYDTRNNSQYFAKITAQVLSGMGIKVYLDSNARPTPQLSFAVKHLKAVAGIVLTASHNPKEYNGYKVYDEFGCQLVPWQAKQVIAYVNAVGDYRSINFNGNDDLIHMMDVTNEFVEAVMKQSRYDNKEAKEGLHIVYTPLHGTGKVPVLQTLSLAGFKQIESVEEQMVENGEFPTVASPNPEDRRALLLGIEMAEKIGADIVLGTDPDSDRVGVAVKGNEGYQLLTGNQIGALLMDFILENTDFSKYKKPAIVKTIVTSELGAEIARKRNVAIFSTLTGFKFIGEKITQFEKAEEENNDVQNFDYVFGYEESYGYLAGTHARDKDAVVASLLICEMAAKWKYAGKTLLDRMNEIYEEYGYYRDDLDSFTLKGKDGLERISSMMTELRNGDSPFEGTNQVIDYNNSVAAEENFGILPTSNVLKYILEDGSWIAVRPSGTEPKIKIYYSIKGTDKKAADEKLETIRQIIITRLCI